MTVTKFFLLSLLAFGLFCCMAFLWTAFSIFSFDEYEWGPVLWFQPFAITLIVVQQFAKEAGRVLKGRTPWEWPPR